jgi:hypothetical protein
MTSAMFLVTFNGYSRSFYINQHLARLFSSKREGIDVFVTANDWPRRVPSDRGHGAFHHGFARHCRRRRFSVGLFFVEGYAGGSCYGWELPLLLLRLSVRKRPLQQPIYILAAMCEASRPSVRPNPVAQFQSPPSSCPSPAISPWRACHLRWPYPQADMAGRETE